MGKARHGFDAGLEEYIRALEQVEGEVDFVIAAALRDVAENFTTAIRRAWPIGKPRPGHRHSATRWAWFKVGTMTFEVRNDAPYADFVHRRRKFGGPPGLAERLFAQAVPLLQQDAAAFVSARTAALLGS